MRSDNMLIFHAMNHTHVRPYTYNGEDIQADGTVNASFDGLYVQCKSEQTVTVQGRNLIPYPYFRSSMVVWGVTITVNNDGAITFNGTAAENISFTIFEGRLPLSPGTKYYFKDVNIQMNGITGNNMNNGYTAKDGDYISYIWEWYNSGTVFDNVKRYPMLQKDIAVTNYEPFVPDSPSPKYPSPIRSVDCSVVSEGKYTAETIPPYTPYTPPTTVHITGCGLGEYRDYYELYWDSKEKRRKIKFVEVTGKYVFNGTIPISLNNIQPADVNWKTYRIGSLNALNRTRVCDYYPFIDWDYSNKNAGYSISSDSGNTGTYIKTNISTAEDFKASLAANPITVRYIRAAPLVTDITDTPEGMAWLAMRTHPWYTNIHSTGTLKPLISAKTKVICAKNL